MDRKIITIADFLTEEEIKQCVKLKHAKEIEQQIIIPNIERINKAIGQENNTKYLAYMVEYAIHKFKEAL